MSTPPDNDTTQPHSNADSQADAMKDQLRKDVASWSATRSGESARQAIEFSVPAVIQPSPPPVKRVRRPVPVPSGVKPDFARKKPFGMSYDGVTAADNITYMIARGAR
jgi:hypothetical protein